MFNVSTIYSTKDFLNLTCNSELNLALFEKNFSEYQYSSSEKVLELSFKCGWVLLDPNGNINITDRGMEIAKSNYIAALLLQLEDMIYNFNPYWASLLPKGRDESKNFLPPNVYQCFKEANLFGNIDDNIVNYWDRLALAYRNFNNQKLLDIGRQGEKLSIEYEFNRTGKPPVWQSVESNLSGYDLLSIISHEKPEPLRIEVKATATVMHYANFIISKNEWDTASISDNYIFHLWDLNNNTLYEIGKNIISKHMPSSQGKGEWLQVRIPFKSVIKE